MRSWILLAALLVPLAAAAGGDPDPAEPGGGDEVPPCVRRAVDAIQRRYESVRDIRARFEQTTRSVALGDKGTSMASRGVVVFAKPGKMRWSYETPEPSLVVSDGRWLWIYDPRNAEAQRFEVGDGYLSGAAIQFLLGEGEILRDFVVAADACDEKEATLSLRPRRPATYEKLRVRAEVATGDLVETEVVDLLGNVTRVAFLEIETNQDPPAETFTFEAPAGVQVIEVETPPQP